jgi:hypothetical protein
VLDQRRHARAQDRRRQGPPQVRRDAGGGLTKTRWVATGVSNGRVPSRASSSTRRSPPSSPGPAPSRVGRLQRLRRAVHQRRIDDQDQPAARAMKLCNGRPASTSRRRGSSPRAGGDQCTIAGSILELRDDGGSSGVLPRDPRRQWLTGRRISPSGRPPGRWHRLEPGIGRRRTPSHSPARVSPGARSLWRLSLCLDPSATTGSRRSWRMDETSRRPAG